MKRRDVVMLKEKMLEVAIRNKFRFNFRGLISVEDLWDLSVQNLDLIFKELNSQIKQVKEESLLGAKTQQDKELDIKIDIIKHIVSTKLEETENRAKSKEIKEQKQKVMEIISAKKDASLENKSVEELEKMLNELED